MADNLLFKIRNSYSPLSFGGGITPGPYCDTCGLRKDKYSYNDLTLEVSGIEKWPLIFGSIHHMAVQLEVAEAFEEAGITGAVFHPVKKIYGPAVEKVSKPPAYYISKRGCGKPKPAPPCAKPSALPKAA